MPKKEKTPYTKVIKIQKAGHCPKCKRVPLQSKLKLTFYDALNQHAITDIHTVPFCNACDMPLATNNEIKTLEQCHPGYHLETIDDTNGVSKTYILKEIRKPARPIQNINYRMPLHIAFFGVMGHACGTEYLEERNFLLHSKKYPNHAVKGMHCKKCGRNILTRRTTADLYQLTEDFPDYDYMDDNDSDNMRFSYGKIIYILNANAYYRNTCPHCYSKLNEAETRLFKKDGHTILQKNKVKICTKCDYVYGKESNFKPKNYSRYKFSLDYRNVKAKRKTVVIIENKDFLTRYNLQHCVKNKHDFEDITARIQLADESGHIKTCDVPAVHCHTCEKYYLLETEYQTIKKQGIPLCAVVEQEHWTNPDSQNPWKTSGKGGSVMYTHGYNVSAYSDLSTLQRQCILTRLIEDGTLTKAEITSHLDTLIKRASHIPVLANARKKWIADRAFVTDTEAAPTVVTVKSITRKTYRKTPQKGANA